MQKAAFQHKLYTRHRTCFRIIICGVYYNPFLNSGTKNFELLQGSWKVVWEHMFAVGNLKSSKVEVWKVW